MMEYDQNSNFIGKRYARTSSWVEGIDNSSSGPKQRRVIHTHVWQVGMSFGIPHEDHYIIPFGFSTESLHAGLVRGNRSDNRLCPVTRMVNPIPAMTRI